jgi:hypothetical protein
MAMLSPRPRTFDFKEAFRKPRELFSGINTFHKQTSSAESGTEGRKKRGESIVKSIALIW